MLLEIEQKVLSLSALAPDGDPGALGSQQEAAELLSSRLQLLKLSLVSFQQLLQGRLEEGPGPRGEPRRRCTEQVTGSTFTVSHSMLSV